MSERNEQIDQKDRFYIPRSRSQFRFNEMWRDACQFNQKQNPSIFVRKTVQIITAEISIFSILTTYVIKLSEML